MTGTCGWCLEVFEANRGLFGVARSEKAGRIAEEKGGQNEQLRSRRAGTTDVTPWRHCCCIRLGKSLPKRLDAYEGEAEKILLYNFCASGIFGGGMGCYFIGARGHTRAFSGAS